MHVLDRLKRWFEETKRPPAPEWPEPWIPRIPDIPMTDEARLAELKRLGQAFQSLAEHPGWHLLLDHLEQKLYRLAVEALDADPDQVTAAAIRKGKAAAIREVRGFVEHTIHRYQELLAEEAREEE